MDNPKTLADVAAAAGVSKMTASRALRAAPDVSAATQEKVRAAAEQLGYVGNPLANSLSSNRSNLIGVLVPTLSNIVFTDLLSGITESFSGTGYQTIFGVTEYDPEVEALAIQNILSWRPAGLVITGLDQPPSLRARLAATDIPVVQVMDLDGEAVDTCVGFSHKRAGADMARALMAAGRRKFGYIGCGLNRDTRAAKRLDGFTAALSEQGQALQSQTTKPGLSSVLAGQQMTAELLAQAPDLDCIYYSNDDMAMGGLFYAMKQGIDVPGHLMLAGFNGLDILKTLPAPIATTITPRRDIGQTAAQVVLNALSGEGNSASPNRIAFETIIDLGL
ncbi:MAG: LacI family DNA-binding transcriptional regulator [Paracoccaceae bacterium]